jgi:hypothetical protein
VKLVERAKALLARTSSGASLGELHLQAMKLLVEKLEKQRFALTARPRRPGESKSAPGNQAPAKQQARGQQEQEREQDREREREQEREKAQVQAQQRQTSANRSEGKLGRPTSSGRHVPAAVKREVFVRDGGCCSYVDERGVRCGATRYLELHHLQPYAQGDQHVAANVTLRCAAHNALAAEEDFGLARIKRTRDSTRHESVAALARANGELALGPDR